MPSGIRKTTPEFIKEAKAVHGRKYDYSRTKYTKALAKVHIVCPKHGVFVQTPHVHVNHKCGCPKCGSSTTSEAKKDSTKSFITKAKIVHGTKYNYSKVKYTYSNKNVDIVCKKHGTFSQRAQDHLGGCGCPTCGGNARTGLRGFITKAKIVHGEVYSYDSVDYKNAHTRVYITCSKHGKFLQLPDSHLRGSGCPHCSQRNYSKIGVQWIKEYAFSHRLKNIQHAEYGGEFYIKEIKSYADGYHKASNTIFEFHGDCYHGNPKVYSPRTKCHPFSNKTAQRLFKETKERELLIRKLGFNLVVIWESDYKAGKKPRVWKAK